MPSNNPSSGFDATQIALCASTFYPKWYSGKIQSLQHTDKVRGDLVIEFAQKGRALGCQVVFVDGGSAKEWMNEIAKIAGVLLTRKKYPKRSPNRRLAIKEGAKLPNVKVIVLTEPEKVSLVTDCLEDLTRPIFDGGADIVVAKRNEELFKQTFPSFYYESEIEANALYNEYLRSHNLLKDTEDLDIFFSPKAFANEPKVVGVFMKRFSLKLGGFIVPRDAFDPEEISDTGMFPAVLALKKKLRVKSVEVPFKYPPLQRENEEIGDREFFLAKRRAQRLGLLLDIIHLLAFLEKNPGSRLKALK